MLLHMTVLDFANFAVNIYSIISQSCNRRTRPRSLTKNLKYDTCEFNASH